MFGTWVLLVLLFGGPSVVLYLQILSRRLRHKRVMTVKKGEKAWALITGASSGLGKEYAYQLSQRGFSCIITARREAELLELKKDLNKLYPDVEVKVVSADLLDPQGIDSILDQIKEQEIELLVSNAGFGYQGRFDKQDIKKSLNVVHINCSVQVELIYKIVEKMKNNHNKTNKGGIIVVSSASAFQPLPYHAVYCAAKSFLSSFGASLSEELSAIGIHVTVAEPATVVETNFQTESQQIAHHGAKPSDVVRDSLEAHANGRLFTTLGIFPWCRGVLVSLLPREFILPIVRRVMLKITPSHMM